MWWRKKRSWFDNKSIVESLRYLTCTGLDILFGVGLVSQYMEFSTTTHLKTLQRILWYIIGTIHYGFFYSYTDDFKLVGIAIVIGLEIMMIEKVQVIMYYLRYSFYMIIEEATHFFAFKLWSRVRCYCILCLSSNLVEKSAEGS